MSKSASYGVYIVKYFVENLPHSDRMSILEKNIVIWKNCTVSEGIVGFIIFKHTAILHCNSIYHNLKDGQHTLISV